VLVLNDKVDLDTVIATPWLTKVARETSAAHGQGMVEDDELVALTTLGRNVPALEGSSIVRLDIYILVLHAICSRSLENDAAKRLDHGGKVLDLLMVLGSDSLELLKCLFQALGRDASGQLISHCCV
jgi:hypothetical protein